MKTVKSFILLATITICSTIFPTDNVFTKAEPDIYTFVKDLVQNQTLETNLNYFGIACYKAKKILLNLKENNLTPEQAEYGLAKSSALLWLAHRILFSDNTTREHMGGGLLPGVMWPHYEEIESLFKDVSNHYYELSFEQLYRKQSTNLDGVMNNYYKLFANQQLQWVRGVIKPCQLVEYLKEEIDEFVKWQVQKNS